MGILHNLVKCLYEKTKMQIGYLKNIFIVHVTTKRLCVWHFPFLFFSIHINIHNIWTFYSVTSVSLS